MSETKYIYNPKTGRNVLKTGKIGKQLFQEEENKKEILEKINKTDNAEELIKLLDEYNGNIMIKIKNIEMPKHVFIEHLKKKRE